MLEKVVGIGIGLMILFILLSSVIMPYYNSAGGVNLLINTDGAGNQSISTATYRGLLMLVFVIALIGIALAFFKKK